MAQKPTLVVMAAGMGSRFGGLKQMTPVDEQGYSIIHYSLYDAWRAGFGKVVFIIKEAIREEFMATVGKRLEKCPLEIRYAYQEITKLPEGFAVPEGRVKPWGTGHAVLCAAEAVDGAPFAAINADDYYGKEAFVTMHSILTSFEGQKDAGMVPYILENTMSENGGVTRAICKIENGQLLYADETKDIQYNEQGKIACARGVLDGKSQVSMNFITE